MVVLIWVILLKCNRQAVISDCIYVYKHLPILERFFIREITLETLPRMMRAESFFLNALVFLPLGIYLPILKKDIGFLKGLLIAFLLTNLLEMAQVITCYGSWSVIDIAANTLGYIPGYLFFWILIKRLSKKWTKIVNVAVMILFLSVAVYAAVKTAGCIEIYDYSNYAWQKTTGFLSNFKR
jgi:glycopeptide antibiotics resistance protein